MMSLKEEKQRLFDHLQSIITNKQVLAAFQAVQREAFVPKSLRDHAYDDMPLPIPGGQTISQPTTVLLMTQFLEVKVGQKILEIGAGSGYQAAILAEIVGMKGKIITVEFDKTLVTFAKKNLQHYKQVSVIHGDGSLGYPKEAPYDRIIVTAACPSIPDQLLDQLKNKGILLAPVGDLGVQTMVRIRKDQEPESLGQFVFVPLQGRYGFQ